MLQALKLDTTVTPVKNRNGTGSPQDLAETAFAGLMAQASFAPMTPTPAKVDSAPREAPPETRTSARSEPVGVQEASRSAETGEVRRRAPEESREPGQEAKVAAKPSEAEEPPPADPQAKAEVKNEADGDTAQAKPAAEAKDAAAQAALPVLPGPAPAAVAPPAASPVTPAGDVQAVQPPGTPSRPGTAAAEAAPRPPLPPGLDQTLERSDEAVAAPVKPALTELLYIPKGEIQTPRLLPDSAKAAPVSPAQPVAEEAPAPAKAEGKNPSLATDTTDLKPAVALPGAPEELAAAAQPRVEPRIQPPPSQELAATTSSLPAMAQGGAVRPATAPVHVEAPAAVRPNPVLAQVEGSVRWILQNKTQGAELQLHPESLGRMVIQLKVEGQDVHARLWASEPTSLAVLQDHKAFLESSLKEQGLNLSSFDLHSGARGDGAQTAQQEQAGSAASRSLVRLEVEQEMPILPGAGSAEAHQIEVYA